MVVITLQRDKCIGCNYCEEFAPDYFREIGLVEISGKKRLLYL